MHMFVLISKQYSLLRNKNKKLKVLGEMADSKSES